jgi:hypothetical protein
MVFSSEKYERRQKLRRERKAAGSAVRKAREDRDDLRGRTSEQVRELRQDAAQSAAVCADCFQPLMPTASVTMVHRRVIIEDEEYLRVPICLTCWLLTLRDRAWHNDLRRFRCAACARPMRIYHPSWWCHEPHLTERVCCADCLRKANNERARLRRRVRHDEIVCQRCGGLFVPKRSDAVTCSNRCRQALHRQRHQQGVTKRAARETGPPPVCWPRRQKGTWRLRPAANSGRY